MELNPFTPFEPVSSDGIPNGAEWISQIKWDGVRILTYYDGKNVKLYNRKLNERTYVFPELIDIKSYTSASSLILDGEVIAFAEDGKPSFHEVMRRDGIRRLERVKDLISEVPIYYMIFDVVFYNGEWITDYSLKERMDLLYKIIKPNPQIQIVLSQSDGSSLFEVVKQYDLEGIITKNLNSKYIIKGKNKDWRKIKNYKDVIAVIGGVTYRSGVVNSLSLGLYDDNNQLCYIGNVGTGRLTNAEWKELTKVVETLKINIKPFFNPTQRASKVQWIQPLLTVKVQFIEWSRDNLLRQPSIQAFVNHPPEICKFRE